jgi:hypothetical protein
MDAAAYTIGIKGRFQIFFKKFKVWGHENQTVGNSVRLSLRLSDGSVLAVPEIEKKWVKVYPDYSAAIEAQRKIKEGLKDASISPQ